MKDTQSPLERVPASGTPGSVNKRTSNSLTLSIVTATYNSSAFVKDCVASVHAQTFAQIEHIIIDGASSDNTLEIINTVPNRISQIISEPDKGIYDAMNKGISASSGDIVGILNSDDFYADESVLEKVADTFCQTGCDVVFGNLDFVSPNDTSRVLRHWKSSPYRPGSFKSGWHPPHPTFFVRRELYERHGLFDISMSVSADFELMLRFMEKHHAQSSYLDQTMVKMRYGGHSTGSIREIIRGNRQIMRAFRNNGISVSPLYPAVRLLPKLKQFITRQS
ncbi:glycosyltransferase [Ruficoccus amylovorans]|uniref:Glycosyltransferase n=2 Tax=Ruficoccus amylovorans TaxID=1804625 RepID=A0A842HKF0_9BACT|nr:glycosyltransferase family 2 protein [Ruficoccus amylovorans]MBC2595631.1 glycosyltransferase [Ruficoccus amylovorans]